MADEDDYIPIQRYGLVGDCHGAALISDLGNVDWCCLGRFDADPVFFGLLDRRRGGAFAIEADGLRPKTRQYLPKTNILVTEVQTDSGVLRVTDFMPVGRAPEAGVHDYVTLQAPFWLVRRFECVEGAFTMRVVYSPTPGWATKPPKLSRNGRDIESAAAWLSSDLDFNVSDTKAVADVTLQSGERRYAVVSLAAAPSGDIVALLDKLQRITTCFWTEWSSYCRQRGQYADMVLRSALTLKALTYAPTGAIVAAPTTSLPECSGGERNWDYRYCWLRDASLTLSALSAMGYSGEGSHYADYLRWCLAVSDPHVRIMYGIAGECSLTETDMTDLDGYAHSQPVRVGNAAFEQLQLDVYGHLFEWAYIFRRLGGRLGPQVECLLRSAAQHITAVWNQPDQGIWEMRRDAQQHIFGKMMCWVAIDRANLLFGATPERNRALREIESFVHAEGVDPATGALRNAIGVESTNAALLLAQPYGYPLDLSVYARTLERVQADLAHGPWVRRYESDDGLSGREGAFVACSFWMVDALLFLNRADEAGDLFDTLLDGTNDLGLLSEEIDPESGNFLGNFPQGLSHIALIQNAHHFDLVERYGTGGLSGGHAERAKLSVGATFGVRAILQAVRQTKRSARVFSSDESKLERFW